MTRFQPKCTTYNPEVEANRKLIKNFKLIVYMPMGFAVAIGVILAIAIGALTKNVYSALFLVLALAGVIYMAVMKRVLVPKFENNNKTIIQKFLAYYKLSQNNMCVHITFDNKNICKTINAYGSNPLYVFVDDQNMFFITSSLMGLNNLSLLAPNVGSSFESILKMDFGGLIIPIEDIDNYRDDEMMVKFKDGVLKLNFDGKRFMDYFIPKKDFYFNVNKK